MTKNLLSTLDLASKTDIGLKRQKNEDSFRILIPPAESAQAPLGALFLVADGMGGLGGGDVASQYAIDEFVRRYYEAANSEGDLYRRFTLALESANIKVREQAPRLNLMRIGSTAAGVLLFPDGRLLAFNVGDCRVYRIRQDRIERISKDQSVTEKQVEAGMITEEDAKNARSSMVTAFLGQPYPIQAFVEDSQAQEGDVYLICSDGLWSLIDAPELIRVIRGRSASAAMDMLVKLALQRGGSDNITAILVRLAKAPNPNGFLLPLSVIGLAAALGLGGVAMSAAANPPTAAPPPTTVPSEPTKPALQIIATATATASPSATLTHTASSTLTLTKTSTQTPTSTATKTPTQTATKTASATPTQTATSTASSTKTPTKTATKTPTASATPTVEATVTVTEPPTATVPVKVSTADSTQAATQDSTATRTPSKLPATPTTTATATPRKF